MMSIYNWNCGPTIVMAAELVHTAAECITFNRISQHVQSHDSMRIRRSNAKFLEGICSILLTSCRHGSRACTTSVCLYVRLSF